MKTQCSIFGRKLLGWIFLTITLFVISQATAQPCSNPALTLVGGATICEDTTTNILFVIEGGVPPWRVTYSINGVPQPEITGITSSPFILETNIAGTYQGLEVYDADDCPGHITNNSGVDIEVDPLPQPAGNISGNTTVCQGQTDVTYSVDDIPYATGYSWTIPSGASITAGSNTHTITINYGVAALSGNITVQGTNDCGSGSGSDIAVTVNPLPLSTGTIFGDATVCAGNQGLLYQVNAVAFATGYEWVIPAGATIVSGNNTNSITVDYSSTAISGNIQCRATNDCGSGPWSAALSVTVTKIPEDPGPVTGPLSACPNASCVIYSTTTIPSAITYEWQLPSGVTIVSGAGTNQIAVNFSSTPLPGNILVRGVNSCGPGPWSSPLSLIINNLPTAAGNISGNSSVCSNQTGLIYSVNAVLYASSYEWQLPTGFTVNGSASNNSINLSASGTATSGIIKVRGVNSCGMGEYSEDFYVTVFKAPTVFAGNNATICSDATYTLSGSTASNYNSLLWNSSGDGVFSNINALHPVYTPSPADIISGNVLLTLTATGNGNCSSVNSTMTLTIIPIATVSAGPDQETCEGSGTVPLNGLAENYQTVKWITSGTGTFTNQASLSTMYLPGSTDISNGSVVLTLEATGNGLCAATVTDNMVLSIAKRPTVNAGSDSQVCGTSQVELDGDAQNYYTINWTSSGNGSFLDPTILGTSYLPSEDDVTSGSVILTLTANPISPCAVPVSDNITVTFTPNPTVDAGLDIAHCGGVGYQITGSSAANYSSIHWSTSGTGTFDNPGNLHPTYLPSLYDQNTGSITLFVEAAGTGNCSTISANDEMVLYINPEPIVDAGAPALICEGSSLMISDASGLYYSSLNWTSSGSGSFVNNGTLTPTYLPSASDLTSGMVILTLTASPLVPCTEQVSSSKILTFSVNPIVYAGTDGMACDNSPYTITDSQVANNGSVLWTTSGSGSFINPSSVSTTYIPSDNDIISGSVILTLTAMGNASCNTEVSDQQVLTISSSPTCNAGSDGVVCENSIFTITNANASPNANIHWTTSGTGILTNASSLTPTYTPSHNDAIMGTVTLTMSVTGAPPCDDIINDAMQLVIMPLAQANAGNNFSVCGATPFTITTATATHYASINWISSGTGTLVNANAVDPTYTPSTADLASGSVILTMQLTSNDPCNVVITDEVLVTLNEIPIVNAGPDIAICEGPHNITGASASNYSSIEWSTPDGDGIFTNGNALNAIYTPGTGDLIDGYVTLTLTAVSLPPCVEVVSDNVIYTINEEPEGYAGPDGTICEGSNYDLSHATAANYQMITWSSSGSGYFNNPNTVNPTYNPSIADILNGSVILTMTLDNSPCQPITDEMTLTIRQEAEANAGDDVVICEGESYTIPDASVSNGGAINWTSSGSGSLQNPTSLSPTYIPSASDIMAGFVQLTLTVEPTAPCVAHDVDVMIISITKSAVAFAGEDVTICENQTHHVIGTNASNYSSISWATSGDGILTSANTLYPTYTPGTIDIQLGYAILTLTAYGNDPCTVPASDQMLLSIISLPDIDAGEDIQICSGSNIALTSASAISYNTLNWTTSGNGTFSDPSLIQPVYTPSAQDIANGTILLTLTGQPLAPCSEPASDALVLQISKSPEVYAGNDSEICETDQYYISDAHAADYAVITWTTMGDGTFSNQNAINPTYTPGNADKASGSVLLYLNATSLLPCTGSVSDAMLLTIQSLPEINAGPNAHICAGETYMIASATAIAYNILSWTSSGTGGFSNTNSLNPIYTPSISDINNGLVTLTLTAQGLLPCDGLVTDEMELSIEPQPIADAGPDQNICEGSYTITTASAIDYNALNWTSSGSSGTLINENTITPTYTPSALDIANGSITLTLTATANSPCTTNAVDQMVIFIRNNTEIYAGADAMICESSTYSPSGATASNYSDLLWTTSGTGSFTNPGTITPTYNPSEADIALGWVNLTLTATSIAPCTSTVSDVMKLTIVKQAMIDAGPNVTICAGTTFSITNATASNYTSLNWSTTGDGTFNNPTLLASAYTPGPGDISNGSVVLRLTGTSSMPCSTPVIDFMTLTIQPAPESDAGPNAAICEDESYSIVEATASNYQTIAWTTSGNGTFLNGSTITPVYTPGNTDIALGFVTITLTTTSIAPCNSTATDSFILTINHIASANAGADASVCEAGSLMIDDATASNYASVNWSSSGTGSFINGSTLNAIYYPSAEDVLAGSVILTLTAASQSPCTSTAIDSKVVSVRALPIVNAGPDGQVCDHSSYNITGATGVNQTSLEWSTSGTGLFSNYTLLNPSYTPSSEDIAAGNVTLTLTALSGAPCTANPSDSFVLTIQPEATADAGEDASVCENNTFTVTDAQANYYSSINWSSNGSGTLTGANGLNPSYTPSAADAVAGSVTLTMTVNGKSPCGNVVEEKVLTISPQVLANAGQDATVCKGANYTLSNATAVDYATINWSTDGSGSFSNPNLINPVYYPSQADYLAGQVVLTITGTSIDPCNTTVSDLMVLQFNDGPIANAGIDVTICEGEPYTVISASATNYTSISWATSGTGNFSQGNTLSPTYTPSVSDLLTGYVTLTLTAHGNPPCSEVDDAMELTFVKQVIANAGMDAIVCEGTSYIVADATAQYYTSVNWSTSGTGVLTNANTLNPTYLPSNADIIAGSVTLTLSAEGLLPCAGVTTSDKMLSFIAGPLVNAGADVTICQGMTFTVNDATSSNTSQLLWTSSGTGFFTGTNTLTPSYTPSIADYASGTVILTLTGQPIAPCSEPVYDALTLTLIPSAIIDAGPDASICETDSYTVSTASASLYNSILWTTTGSGTLINPSTLTPTYTPSITDIEAGSVTLTLTALSGDPCNNEVSDYMILTMEQVPEVYAGIDGTICEGDSFTVSGATATDGFPFTWSTNGTGSFENSNTLSPDYIPSPADINNGSVILTLTVESNSSCSLEVSDGLLLSIDRLVTVEAGEDATICKGQNYTLISATVSNQSSVTWTTSGTGNFTNPAIVKATYQPSAADIANGSVVLTLSANANGVCTGTLSDMMVLSFRTPPIVNAGLDITACDQSVTINDATANNFSSLLWSTSGTGTISNGTTLTPTYTPSTGDIASGYVNLTLTAQAIAPCTDISTDMMEIAFNQSPIVSAGVNGSICEGNTFQVNGATALNTSLITWTTSGTGTFNDIHLLNPIYSPSTTDIDNGTVTLTITGNPIVPCTNAVSSDLTLTLTPLPTAFAGGDHTSCGTPYLVSGATATNYSSLLWSTSGTGTFVNETSLTPTYIPSATDISVGFVNLTLTVQSQSPCSIEESDFMVLTLPENIAASAGTDESICEGSTFQVTTATASNYESIDWSTSGTGTFSNQNTLNPVYTPGATDIANGNVTLTVTAISIAPCNNTVVDQMLLTINQNPQADAGPDQAICQGSSVILSGSVTNSPLVDWSTSGDGFFTNNSTLTPTYTPGTGDILAESAVITLTAYPSGSCTTSAVDQMIITISQPAEVYAGNDETICSDTYTLATATAANFSSVLWTTSGTGIFINGTTVNPTYVASLADIESGSVTLVLTATEIAPCTSSVSDQMIITFTQMPSSYAGQDASVCGNVSYSISDAYAANYSSVVWSTSGNGLFSNSAEINPVYYPTVQDFNAGHVTLTLSVTGLNLCNTIITDQMELTFSTQPVADAGNDISSCGTTAIQITGASAEGYNSLYWTHNGTGVLTGSDGLTPVYTPSQGDVLSGHVILTLHAVAVAPCTGEVTDALAIDLMTGPVVLAGMDITICQNENLTIIGATATDCSTILWSSNGSGSFSNPTVTNPVYYPSEADISAGTITLTLTGTGINPCNTIVNDFMVLTINKLPIADAGPDELACNDSYQLSQASAQNYSSVIWTTSGTGIFSDATLVNPVYTPSASDITAGSIILTLKANALSPCNSQVADAMKLTIGQDAVANAGLNGNTCGTNPFTVVTSSASSGTITWTTSGSGTFANQNTLNPTYTPSNSDVSIGSVILTMQVQSAAPCFNIAQDDMVLFISGPATVFAGSDASICNGTNYTVTGASASNCAAITWSSTGTGTFVSGNTISPTYLPSFADYQNGSVILSLNAIPQSPCTGSVYDEMLLTFINGALADAGPDAEICFGNSFSVTGATALGASTISWSSTGSGSLVNGGTISPTYVPSNADLIAGEVILTMTVYGSAPCLGSSTDNMTLTICSLPTEVANIIGPQDVCEGQTNVIYTVNPPVPHATSYNWLLPPGATMVSGNSTSTITVDFGINSISGSIYVTPVSACGSGTMASLAIIVDPAPEMPGTIVGITDVCLNSSNVAYSVDAVLNADSYQWTVPSGATIVSGSGTNSILVDFSMTAVSGNLTVFTMNDCGSSLPSSLAINVLPIPEQPVIIANGPVEFCEGGSVVLSATPGFDSYLWSNGMTTPDITVTQSGTYSVVASENTGCSSLPSNEITVNVNTIVTPDITVNGSPILCEGDSVILTAPAGFVSYLWSTGETTENITVTITGSYFVTVTDNFGCTSSPSQPVTITVNELPAAPTITADGPLTLCEGGSVTLSAPEGYASYAWSNGETTKDIIVQTAGSYYVIVSDAGGCASPESNIIVVDVLPLPVVNAGTDIAICQQTNYTVTGASASNYSTIYWTTSGTGTFINPDIINPTYIPSSADISLGSVVLTLTGYGCDQVSDFMILTIIAQPIVDAGGDLDICYSPSPVTNATASNYSGLEWSVSFGSGTLINETSLMPTYLPSASDLIAGYAILTLTAYPVSPCNNAVSVTKTLNIHESALANAGIDEVICSGASLIITTASASNQVSLQWSSSGTGTWLNANTLNPTYIPSTSDIAVGTVYLTLTAINSGCPAVSDLMVLTIQPEATVYAGPDGNTCEGSNFTITGATASLYESVLWTTSGTGIFSDPAILNPEYLPSPSDVAIGNVQLTLTVVSLAPCSESFHDAMTLVMKQEPMADAGTDGTICQGQQYVVTDASAFEYSSLVWSTSGSGFFLNGTTLTPTYIPSQTDVTAGSVILTLISSNPPCADFSDSQTLAIIPTATVEAGPDVTICQSCSHTVSGAFINNAQNFVWTSTGTGLLSNANTLTPTYQPSVADIANGSVTLILTAESYSGCGSFSDQMVIYINQNPQMDFTWEGVCEGQPTTFIVDETLTPINAIGRWQWNFGDGFYSNVMNPTHTFSATGAYTVSLTATDTLGNLVIVSHIVEIQSTPIAFFSIETPNCLGSETQFVNLSSTENGYITRWVWNYGDGSAVDTVYFPDNPNVTHTYATQGIYQTSLNVTNSFGCENTYSTEVTVTPNPIANFYFSSSCEDLIVDFTDASYPNGIGNIVSWNWDFGDPGSGVFNSSNLTDPQHLYSTAGTYTVTLYVLNFNDCSDTITKQVNVGIAPPVAFTWNSACVNTATNFFTDPTVVNINTIASYLWEFGDGGQSTLQDPQHSYATSGMYTTTLTITDTAGCTNSVSNLVEVSPTPVAYFGFTEPTCFQSEVQFTSLSSSEEGYITTWVWNFGDGNSTTVTFPDDPNLSHLYANAGVYNVTLDITTSLGCENSVTRQVTVIPNPVANFSFAASCLNEPVNFTDLSQPNGGGQVINWSWDFGDPTSGIANNSTMVNPTHIYAQPGTYTVELNITTSNSCSDTISKTIVIAPAPVVDFTASSGCTNDTVVFVSSTFVNINATLSWLWDFGDGSSSTVIDPEHIYTSTGNYNVSLTITDTAGCLATISRIVNVIPGPTAMFTYVAPACSGSDVQFTNMSTAVGSSIVSWHWDFGDGNEVTVNAPDDPNVTHSYATSGVYTVTLTVTNLSGCDASISSDITIIDSPTSNFSFEAGCQGTPVQFNDLSTNNGGQDIIQWLWDFGDAASGASNTSVLQNPLHTYSVAGNYNVSLTITSVAGCYDSIIQQITVNEPPAAAFIYSNSCSGQEIVFEPDTSVMNTATIVGYVWDFGDGSATSTQMAPSHIYTVYGTYTVTLTVTDLSGCISTISQTIHIAAIPVAAFTSTSTCTGNLARFTDYSYSPTGELITTWNWTFNDPNAVPGSDTSSLQNPVYMFSNPGTYNVTLTVTSASGCSGTIVIPVEVFPAPTAAYSYTTNACLNGTVSFQDESSSYIGAINSWSWEFEPNYYSNLQNPHHTFYQTDSCYNVQLSIVDMRGCADTIIQEVCIPIGLDVAIESTTTCFGDSTWFNPHLVAPVNDSLVAFEWIFDDLSSGIYNTSSLRNPGHYFAHVGTYLVSLTATDINNCQTTVYSRIDVKELPIPSFTYTAGSCDSTLYFTDLSNGNGSDIATWIWNYGDGNIDTLYTAPSDTSHYYAVAGTFTVTLTTITSSGCSNSYSLTIDKMPCIVAGFTQLDTLICERHTLTFEDHSICGNPIDRYTWYFGDGDSLSYSEYKPTVEHLYELMGTYNVSLVVSTTVSGISVSDTLTQSVVVVTSPKADFATSDVCLNANTIFTDQSHWTQSQIDSWSWNFGDLQSITDTTSLRNPTYRYPRAGKYNPMLTVANELGCTDTISKLVTVHYLPEANFTYSLSCQNNRTFFTDISDSADAAINQWWWKFSDSLGVLGLAGVQDPDFIFKNTGNYQVEMVVVNQNGCSDTTTKDLTVNPKPTSAFTMTQDYENTQGRVLFTNGSIGANSYEWDFDIGTTSFELDPIVDFPEDGTYEITLVSLNEFDCPDTLKMDYTMNFKSLWMPNAFSPNNPNPEVRLFKPIGINLKYYQIEIYDTWGNLLWTSNELDENGSPAEGWNGIFNGNLLPQDTYMWKVSAVFKDGSIWNGTSVGNNHNMYDKTYGTVNLIR